VYEGGAAEGAGVEEVEGESKSRSKRDAEADAGAGVDLVGTVRRAEEEDEGGAERRSIDGDAEEAGLREEVEDRVGSGVGVEEVGAYQN